MMAAVAQRPAIRIRRAEPTDQAFVTATMAEQLQRGRHKDANKIVNAVLSSSLVRVILAVNGHDRILGWLCYVPAPRARTVLFVYVRRQERTQGIARELVHAAFPSGGQLVHGGLRGSSSKALLARFPAIEEKWEELI